jgi:hypothetical protein
MEVDLYEDEAGGLYLHCEGDAYIFPITLKLVTDMEDTLHGVPGANVFEALAVEVSVLTGTGSSWLDHVERLPFERIGSTARVANYSDSGIQIHDGSTHGTLPPGPIARRMLRDLGDSN